jgi:hypothetical protein
MAASGNRRGAIVARTQRAAVPDPEGGNGGGVDKRGEAGAARLFQSL